MHQKNGSQNIDWVKFDEIYEQTKLEIFWQPSAKKSKVSIGKILNYWQSSGFYHFYKKVYTGKKLFPVLNFMVLKNVLSLKH